MKRPGARKKKAVASDSARDASLTIEQLTQETGTSTRNIRAFQSRGLLAGPRLVGRRGFYDRSHVERIVLIRKLQQRGYKLGPIRELLEHWKEGAGSGEVLNLQAALASRLMPDAPRRITRAELRALLPELTGNATLLKRATALELFTPEGDGWLVRSSALLSTARELQELGVPAARVLDELEQMRQEAEQFAGRMRSVFQSVVFEPYARAGFPAEQLPRVTETVRRLRDISVRAVLAVFSQAIERGPSSED